MSKKIRQTGANQDYGVRHKDALADLFLNKSFHRIRIINVKSVNDRIISYPASEALRRLAVPALLTGSDADDVSVDRARDAVVHLGVQLGEDVP